MIIHLLGINPHQSTKIELKKTQKDYFFYFTHSFTFEDKSKIKYQATQKI